MDRENIIGQMDPFTWEISLKAREKAQANGYQAFKKEIFTLASIKKTRRKGKENMFGRKDALSKARSSLT